MSFNSPRLFDIDKKLWLFALIITTVSILLELYGRSCGFIETSDSLQYLSAAKSFAFSGEFLSPDGTRYTFWPPLFPIMLSMAKNPLAFLSIINIVCKVIMAIVLVFMADKFLKKTELKVFFMVGTLLSVQLLMISVFVWSELLFMAFLLLNFFSLLNLSKSKTYLFLLIGSGFLMCLQRNAGLFWISGVCLWLTFYDDQSFFKNFIKASLIFILCTAGLWAWNFYNTFFIEDKFSFYEHAFFADFPYNANLIVHTYIRMLLPAPLGWVSWIIFLILIIIGYLLLRSNWDRYQKLLLILLLVYSLGYAAMVKLDVYEMERYLSVVLPIFMLLILIAFERGLETIQRPNRFILVSIVLLWAAYPITRTIKNVQLWHERSCLMESPK